MEDNTTAILNEENALQIKDDLIKEMQQTIKSLNIENAKVKNQVTNLEIDLAKTRAVLDAQTNATPIAEIVDDYLDDEMMAKRAMETV